MILLLDRETRDGYIPLLKKYGSNKAVLALFIHVQTFLYDVGKCRIGIHGNGSMRFDGIEKESEAFFREFAADYKDDIQAMSAVKKVSDVHLHFIYCYYVKLSKGYKLHISLEDLDTFWEAMREHIIRLYNEEKGK